MATTYYHTVNGRIRGETTAGVRTDYLTDALGSVVATVNSSAQVVNTYRYKPYGERLAKTGVAQDPSNTWVGSLGYRACGLQYAESYVRRRHFDAQSGRWSTPDPQRLSRFSVPADYVYAFSSPVRFADPSGLLSCDATCCTEENKQKRISGMGGSYEMCSDTKSARKACDDFITKNKNRPDKEEFCGRMWDYINGKLANCVNPGGSGATQALVWCRCGETPSGSTRLEYCGNLCNTEQMKRLNPCQILCLVGHENYHGKECGRDVPCNPNAGDGMGFDGFREECAYLVEAKCLFNTLKAICQGTGRGTVKTWDGLGDFPNYDDCLAKALGGACSENRLCDSHDICQRVTATWSVSD